jgi:DNA primase
MKPKYYCAKEGQSVFKGSHILYPFDTGMDYVVVCEGPFDARSLQIQGINATCTTGMSVSETQLDALRMFRGKLIFGYDNDKAGEAGLKKADNMRKKKLMPALWYCPPPKPFKDWNEAHQKDFDLKSYVLSTAKPYTVENYILSALSTL